MLNAIWLILMVLSVIVGIILGRVDQVILAVTDSAKFAFELILGLTGILAFWLGIMKIAEQAGFINVLARVLKPVMRRLFPGVPSEHPAMGSMILNITANMLGLANAATPFGLQAMKELNQLNNKVDEASDAMCMFLAINTSSVQLLPTTAIAFLAANGSLDPTSVVASSLFATICSTAVAITAAKTFAHLSWFKRQSYKEIAHD